MTPPDAPDAPVIAYRIGESTFCAACWLLIKRGTAHTCPGLAKLVGNVETVEFKDA